MTVSAYRERMDCNRKCAMALLVHFDGEGLTERQGDLRVPSGIAIVDAQRGSIRIWTDPRF